MAIKATSTAKVGKLNLNSIVRFNGTSLSKTNIKEGDTVFIEYHKDKIVIKKMD